MRLRARNFGVHAGWGDEERAVGVSELSGGVDAHADEYSVGRASSVSDDFTSIDRLFPSERLERVAMRLSEGRDPLTDELANATEKRLEQSRRRNEQTREANKF